VLIIAAPAWSRPFLAPLPDDVELRYYEGADDAAGVVADAEILWLALWRLEQSTPAVSAGRRLRWISTNGAGINFFPLELIRTRGIVLTNGRGLNSIPIAECAVMGMLALAKGLPRIVKNHTERRWVRRDAGRGELRGTSALIVGYGSIGRAIADRLRPFGVQVTGVRRIPNGEAGVIGPEDWRPRLGEFDWVIVSAPLTPATRHLIGESELASMRMSACVVNIARGGLIDERALAGALRSGAVAGAYLDVTEQEPLPAESELWDLPNLILTPHSSGITKGAPERAAARFLENLARYQSGAPLDNVVDLERGY
jgi:phosphoglycerate dehydrogenase-like enzyme